MAANWDIGQPGLKPRKLRPEPIVNRICAGCVLAVLLLLLFPATAGVVKTDEYILGGYVTYSHFDPYPDIEFPPENLPRRSSKQDALAIAAFEWTFHRDPKSLKLVKDTVDRLRTPESYALLVDAIGSQISDRSQEVYKTGKRLFALQRPFPEAKALIEACEAAAMVDPDNAEFPLLRAYAFAAQGKKGEALAALRIAGRLPRVDHYYPVISKAILTGSNLLYGEVAPWIPQLAISSQLFPLESAHQDFSKWVKALPKDQEGLAARADILRAHTRRYRQAKVAISMLVSLASISIQLDHSKSPHPRPDPKSLASLARLKHEILAAGEGSDIPWDLMRKLFEDSRRFDIDIDFDEPPLFLINFDTVGSGTLIFVLAIGAMIFPFVDKRRDKWIDKAWRFCPLAGISFAAFLALPHSLYNSIGVGLLALLTAYLTRSWKVPPTWFRVILGIACLTPLCVFIQLAIVNPEWGLVSSCPYAITAIASCFLLLRTIEWRVLFIAASVTYLGISGIQLTLYRLFPAKPMDDSNYISQYRDSRPL